MKGRGKMKKGLKVLVIASVLTMASTVTSLAAGWEKRGEDWVYADVTGTLHNYGWEWIDGNLDGIAECYYFSPTGIMASNTTIYGDEVNEQGQWVVDGVVQTKMINYEFEDPFTGETVDAREEFGYKGLMSFINDLGIDAITNVYSKEKFKEVCGMLYYYALKEDINRIGDIVYGDDDNQKAALEAEALQYQTGG